MFTLGAVGHFKYQHLGLSVRLRLEVLLRDKRNSLSLVNIGGGVGFGTDVALACIHLGIPYTLYAPFKDFTLLRGTREITTFEEVILPKAQQVVYLHTARPIAPEQAHFDACKEIIDSSNALLCYCNQPGSNIERAVHYAREKNKSVFNVSDMLNVV